MEMVTVRQVAEQIRSADELRRMAECDTILGICAFAEGYCVDTGELLRVLAERRVRMGADGTPLVSEFVCLELAGLLRCSAASAGHRVVEALNLKHRHPRLVEAMEQLQLEPKWALRAASKCSALSPETAANVTDQWLQRQARLGYAAAFNLLDKLIMQADLELAAERERTARADRGVHVWGLCDGVMNLTGRLDVLDAAHLEAALDQMAEAIAVDHPQLSKQQRRAKAIGVLAHPALALSILQRAGQQPLSTLDPEQPTPRRLRPRATVAVHIDADAVCGLPATSRVERAGEITTALLAELLGEVEVRVQPVIDLPNLEPDDGYVPRVGIRRAVLFAMEREMFLYSNRSSAGLDLDHTRPYRPHIRGQTGIGNLAPLSRRVHRAKTMRAWTSEQPKPAVLIWRSPLGYRYEVTRSGTRMLM